MIILKNVGYKLFAPLVGQDTAEDMTVMFGMALMPLVFAVVRTSYCRVDGNRSILKKHNEACTFIHRIDRNCTTKDLPKFGVTAFSYTENSDMCLVKESSVRCLCFSDMCNGDVISIKSMILRNLKSGSSQSYCDGSDLSLNDCRRILECYAKPPVKLSKVSDLDYQIESNGSIDHGNVLQNKKSSHRIKNESESPLFIAMVVVVGILHVIGIVAIIAGIWYSQKHTKPETSHSVGNPNKM